MIETTQVCKVNMGTGDVCLTSRCRLKDDKAVGTIAFKSQKAMPIGESWSAYHSDTDMFEFPVQFNFTATKSIDVLIKQLNALKNKMQLMEDLYL